MNCVEELDRILGKAYRVEQEKMSKAKSPVFAYYTNADTAYQIISNEEIWMRNAALMNDFSEIKYGLHIISKVFGSGSQFHKNINLISERLGGDLFTEFAKFFDDWVHDLETNTFLTCISKHFKHEDDFGRLSMWRAYGGRNGVALVLDAAPMLRDEVKLKVYSIPVLYETKENAVKIFENKVLELDRCFQEVSRENWDEFKSVLAYYLKVIALSLKHPGFKEEQEWRVFYRPSEEESEFVTSSIETIDGLPQTVQRLRLSADADISIKDLVRRVIIGPSEHQYQVADTLAAALEAKGISKPWEMIKVSSIPLRN